MTTTGVAETHALISQAAIPTVKDYRAYVNAVYSIPILTAEEEREMALEVRDKGSRRSAMDLVCTHLRQVVAIARGYSGYGLPEPDLVQEGNVGLMKAVKNFDPDQKARLSTYAAYWIKAAINEFVIRNWKIVKVATTSAQRKLFFNLRRMTTHLGRRLGVSEVGAIADELDVPRRDVVEMEKRLVNYDQPYESNELGEDEYDGSPSTYLASAEADPETRLLGRSEAETKHEALAAALAALNDREREIVMGRALSESGKDVGLGELGERLGISAERVRQIEKKAMLKIEKRVLASCAGLGS